MMHGYEPVDAQCDDRLTDEKEVGPGVTATGCLYTGSRNGRLSEKVTCDTCFKTYASKKSLKIHMRTHTGYKPYACHMCPKRFAQTNVLKAHINAHTGRRDWICKYCSKAFTQSAHLRTHEKIHLHRRDYYCSYCQQSFGSKGVRDRHIRQHTGEKPYKCSQCPKSFTRGESLKFHENAHKGIRPYHCQHTGCQSTFTKQSSLKRHVTTCHSTSSVAAERPPGVQLSADFAIRLPGLGASSSAAVTCHIPHVHAEIAPKMEEFEPEYFPGYYGYLGGSDMAHRMETLPAPIDCQRYRMMCTKPEAWASYTSGQDRIYVQDPFAEFGTYGVEAWNSMQFVRRE
ncbi:zinc finger protein 112-like [Paramacrobiotus metropolitanus]|uniref:zinc finger protein 112-like n=1 Tax=Paramacrobiotus metropolitanus TaxID=2943436 RepID=UPI002445BF4F|nr:zinc finger protein 112-like [Paramacrobiotus metropolitanus]